MKYMNIARKFGSQLVDNGRNLCIAGFVGASALGGNVFAQVADADDAAAVATAKLATSEPGLWAIGGAVLSAVAVLVIIRLMRRAA